MQVEDVVDKASNTAILAKGAMREKLVHTSAAVDFLIRDVAARQHGLVTRAQLLAAGASADTVRRRAPG